MLDRFVNSTDATPSTLHRGIITDALLQQVSQKIVSRGTSLGHSISTVAMIGQASDLIRIDDRDLHIARSHLGIVVHTRARVKAVSLSQDLSQQTAHDAWAWQRVRLQHGFCSVSMGSPLHRASGQVNNYRRSQTEAGHMHHDCQS